MLRIIGGDLRRRLIHTPPDTETTRPMPDRVRESLFNLLRGHTEGFDVFDGFAGSGALGFECLSRGARQVVFFERERRVAKLIERTASELGLTDRCEIAIGDALGAAAVARCPEGVHLVFFDPPYPIVRDPAQWPRVREQFGRLIERLDATGYAMLRTPWPFLHDVRAEPEPESEQPRRREKRRNRRREQEDETAGWIEIDPAEAEEILLAAAFDGVDADEPGEGLEDELTPARQAQFEPVDLRIPGAIGPETHVYGTTAVHLYMRSPPA
ncbi:MAG: RsmD family RNA methyltransferase [Phycisphaerales bacterium]|nr:RsmD family RNA methyltransferase [Phycisphaerales bacterium]